jgi:CelD/BcsL family acetyltransferase involved in cellulose biosynthesis
MTAAPPAFAHVELFDDPASAREIWRALAPCGSFYQSEKFVLSWLETCAAKEKATPFFISARDESGAPVAFLPLFLFRRGPLRLAQFSGGKEANYNLGLFADPDAFSGDEMRRLLRAAGRLAAAPPHLYRLINLPKLWQGKDNPLTRLPSAPSASPAFWTPLAADGEAFLREKLSADTRKKMRKKEKALAEIGVLRYWRAEEDSEAARLLDACFALKAQRFESFAGAEDARSFYGALSRGESAAEWHALAAGERLVALFCGGVSGGRLQGLLNAFDPDPAVARCSPGDLLLARIFTDACARGLDACDLGVGEARYKRMFCGHVDEMADALYAPHALGAPARVFFAAAQAAKRAIKNNPRMWNAIILRRRRAAQQKAEEN